MFVLLFVISITVGFKGIFNVLGLAGGGDGIVGLGYAVPCRTRGVGGVSGGKEVFTFFGVASPE